MSDSFNELQNATGVLAETSLMFFRALRDAGASLFEASLLVQAYMEAMVTGKKEKGDELVEG